jgi:hypothetical protein
MAAWLIPALKTILPLVGTIITAATPVFPKRSTDTEPNQALLLQQQIAELQSAASRNAENTKELAAQLQDTVTALEQVAAVAQSRLQRAFAFSLVASAVSLIAVCVALFGVLTR